MIDMIVLSRDRPDYFASCLEGLADQGVDYHGVLVDNGTTDHTAAMAHDAGWDVLDFGRNTSFSEGNNLAVAHTEAERFVLLNDDARLGPGALKAMLGHDEAVVGCLIVESSGVVNHAGGYMHRGLPWHEGRGTAAEQWACHSCQWVTFASVCIWRRAWEDVGPMDEGYWYSHEDADWCLRAGAFGHEIVMCADAVVRHDECGTRGRGGQGKANEQRFLAKWADRRGDGGVRG